MADHSAELAGIAAGGIGTVVLVGWHFGIPFLMHGGSLEGCVQYNTAVGFILCGACVGLARQKARLAAYCGAGAIALSAATLSQYIFGFDLGIDQFLMEDYLQIKTSHPGRMAPNTAICFLLIGGTPFFWQLARSVGRLLVVNCACGVLAIGLVSLLGHTARVEAAFGWGEMTKMSLPTTCCFLVLSVGVLVSTIRQFMVTFGALPTWLPYPAVCCFLAASVGVAISQRANNRENTSLLTLNECMRTRNEIFLQVKSLERMALRWEANAQTDIDAWRDDARVYSEHFPGLRVIAWITPDRKIGASVVKQGAAGAGEFLDPAVLIDEDLLETARARVHASPLCRQDNLTNPHWLQLYLPLSRQGAFHGVITAVFDDREMFDRFHEATQDRGYLHKIIHEPNGGGMKAASLSFDDPMQQELPLEVLGQGIKLRTWPTENQRARMATRLPVVTVSLGALMAVFLGLLISAAQRLQKGTQRLSTLNTTLRREISVREQRERDLQASDERLSRAVTHAPFPIMIHAEDGHVLQISRSWCEITGYAADEIKTIKDWVERAFSTDMDQSQALDRIRSLFSITAHHPSGERYIKTKSGERRMWDFSSAPLGRLSDGRRVVVSMAVDVTDRNRTLATLEQSAKALERSNIELERFAYVASHDLQEPLRMVSSYLQLIESDLGDSLDERSRRYFHFAVDGASRMKSLIIDLLTYSRLQSSAVQIAPVAVNQVVEDALALLAYEIKDSGAIISVDDLPTIHADRDQLTRLMQNLIGNAIKYRSKDRTPHITVSAVEENGEWRFAVQDNGIGIEAKYFEHIFVLFKRLHGRSEFSGTGIGLAVCKTIVERHGGHIGVESTFGQGTTLSFTLPKAQETDEHNEPDDAHQEVHRDLVGGGQPR